MCNILQEIPPVEMFFNLFDEVIDLLVLHSTRYAARTNKLGDISTEEMKCFVGILLLSGYVSMPRRRMYWENSPDIRNELVAKGLSRNRFEFIFSNLHCCDNDNLDVADRFSKIRLLVTLLNEKFQEFSPHWENHSVDEAMVPYYGKHGCKQFIQGKPIKYGYKMCVGYGREVIGFIGRKSIAVGPLGDLWLVGMELLYW